MDRKGNRKLVPLARNLRKEMTREERKLWYQFLHHYPVRFYRQKVLGKYIADFYCAKAKLVIELDGSQHYEEKGQEKDAFRTRYLEGYDLEVLRIANNQLRENFEGVCAYIDWIVKQRVGENGTTPQSQCAHWDSSPCTGELMENRGDITTPQSSALRETAADSSPYAGEFVRKETRKEPPLSKGRCHGASPTSAVTEGLYVQAHQSGMGQLNGSSVRFADRYKTPCTGELMENRDDITTPQSSALRETTADSSPCAGELIRKDNMKTVELYTDGACSGNPGPGGWGVILRYNGVEKELSGGEEMTTNNRMELTAVIQGLLALKESCVVELWSDSKYVIDALEKGWAWGWRKKGWIKSDKKPALNPDLWTMLLDLCGQHEMHYHWVKGHADNEFNNRCDALAVAEREKFA